MVEPLVEQPINPEVQTEPTDVYVGSLIAFAVGLTVSIVAIMVVVGAIFNVSQSVEARTRARASPLARRAEEVLPPEPRLEQIDRMQNERKDAHGERLEAREPPGLQRYRWVDENHNIAQIPVERAMQILTKDHPLPARTGRQEGAR